MLILKTSSFFFNLTISVLFWAMLIDFDAFSGNRFDGCVPKISYKIIPSVDLTWGYDIYLDGKLVIHQPLIPAVSGNKGFATQEQATNVARAIVLKIKNGIMPPTITQEELKKLNAI